MWWGESGVMDVLLMLLGYVFRIRLNTVKYNL
jgi:hypothetical protein